MTPEPASSVVIAASVSRVRRKAIPGMGKPADDAHVLVDGDRTDLRERSKRQLVGVRGGDEFDATPYAHSGSRSARVRNWSTAERCPRRVTGADPTPRSAGRCTGV